MNSSLKDRIESEGFGDFIVDNDIVKPIYEEIESKKEEKIEKSEENEMDYKKWL